MAYTITQARPLLTAPELKLFEQSRAQPIKHLTPAALAGAVKRTRTLRDKYRDLYRRQTVGVRSKTPGTVTGEDNERTQRKADILQEVLERYEARVERINESGGTSSSKAKGSASSGKAAAKAVADKGVKKTASKKTSGAAKADKGAAAFADKASPKTTSKTAKSSNKPKADKADKKIKSANKDAVSAQLNTLGGVMAEGNLKGGATRSKAGKAPSRSTKAPSRKAPTANNKASAPDINAPLDTLPGSKRSSPLKNNPTSIAVQAHQSSRGRRAQGKRDSR